MTVSTEFDSWAYFTVTTERPLSEIAAHFGVEGEYRSWSIGDQHRLAHRPRYKFSRWSMVSGVEKGFSLDDHLRALWRRMSGFREEILNLPADMNGWVQCVASFRSHQDMVELAAGHFSTAAYYQLNMDFDFYFDDGFGDDEEGTAYWDWKSRKP